MRDREALANLFVEQIRELSGHTDPRSDDELKGGPFGGYAAADAVIHVDRWRAEGRTSDEIDVLGRLSEFAAGINPCWVAGPGEKP